MSFIQSCTLNIALERGLRTNHFLLLPNRLLPQHNSSGDCPLAVKSAHVEGLYQEWPAEWNQRFYSNTSGTLLDHLCRLGLWLRRDWVNTSWRCPLAFHLFVGSYSRQFWDLVALGHFHQLTHPHKENPIGFVALRAFRLLPRDADLTLARSWASTGQWPDSQRLRSCIWSPVWVSIDCFYFFFLFNESCLFLHPFEKKR